MFILLLNDKLLSMNFQYIHVATNKRLVCLSIHSDL